jgi:5'-nucleotidase (lipoprotein e(P4) family)
MRVRIPAYAIAAVLVAGCAGHPVVDGSPVPAAAGTASTEAAVHWARDAAEHDALFVQTYRWAGERIRSLSMGRTADTWAVILDADETVLDNSTYQKERLPEGGRYTPETWSKWVERREATALPGAGEFIALVRQLGGRVAIVTNRAESECPATRENLDALRIRVDVVLCRKPGPSDKNPRFESVRTGTASPDLPTLDVLMWVGDNVQDFPALSQDIRTRTAAAYADFGARFVVVPNPMYGSWEANPWR